MSTFRTPQVVLFSDDLPRAVAFYTRLGFAETFGVPADNEPVHVDLSLDGYKIGIGSVASTRDDHGLDPIARANARPHHIDPGQYAADQAVLGLPGRAQYMTDRCGITSTRSRATSNSTPGCATAAPRCSPSGGAMTHSSSQPVRMRTAATFQTRRSSCSTPATSPWRKRSNTIATNVDAFLVKHHS